MNNNSQPADERTQPPPLVGFGTDNQLGEAKLRDVAGENITHNYGMSGGDVARVLESFADELQYRRMLEDNVRPQRQEHVDRIAQETHDLLIAIRNELATTQRELQWIKIVLIISGMFLAGIVLVALFAERVEHTGPAMRELFNQYLAASSWWRVGVR